MGATLDALARPSALLALAAGLLAGAIMDTVGFFGPGALAMTSAAAVLAVAASARARRAAGPAAGEATGPLLRVLVGLFLGYDLVKSRRDLAPLALLGVAVLLLAAEVLGAAAARRGQVTRPGERVRFWLWCACAAALVVRDVRARDGSFIDVWVFQQDASAALLAGRDPYSITYRNIYGDLRFYGEAVADASRVRAYPYPPQTILADVPAFALLGDVRYAFLAALLASAWALSRLAPAGLGNLAAAALLFHPGTRPVLRSAWTEPGLLAPLLLLALAIRRHEPAPPRGWAWVGAAGALAAGAKQYSPLLLAPLVAALPARGRLRATAAAAVLAAAVVLPFVAWDARGLWDGVVAMQFRQPFRPDSLSWPAALVRLGFPPPSGLVGFALAAAVLVWCWPRGRSLSQAVTCGAAGFLALLLAAKQAFLNYYWLADGLLLAAAVLQLAEERARSRAERAS